MGLTCKSCKKAAFRDIYKVVKKNQSQKVIALAGNPNTGKSTVFNALTGLKQHTGNWPGKTVTNAQGFYKFNNEEFILVDLPGTYSLMANSVEEQIARDFICFGNPDAIIVVADATCLERNLNLALQVMEITNNVVLCVNLLDEAKRKNIDINLIDLSRKLGIPVVGTIARNGVGLNELKNTVYNVSTGKTKPLPKSVKYPDSIEKYVKELIPKISPFIDKRLNAKWVALRILDGDESILERIQQQGNYNTKGLCKECKGGIIHG